MLVGLVRYQQRLAIDFQVQQVPDSVGVFRAVQPMDRHMSRIRLCDDRRIQGPLQVSGDGIIGGFVGPRRARRRHLVRAEFGNDFFPDLGIAADMLEIQLVDHEAGGLARLVVASDAVLREHGGRSLIGSGRAACLRERHGGQKALPNRH